MIEEERLLKPSHLPSSLWDSAAETLIIPASLAEAYCRLIDRHNLRGLSGARNNDDPPVGGITQERTDQHFAQAFDGSVARAQLSLLDPKAQLVNTSNTCLASIAGNRVSVTDAPCGAGAAALAYLANVAHLRSCGVLPRLPLDVYLIGGELSEPARTYAAELLEEIKPFLEEQAISVTAEFNSWDVTDDMSNTNLIRRMTFASGTHPNRLLVVANFNAFLEIAGKRREAGPRLTELFRHASGPQSVAIWIEPDMNRATQGLFPWIRGMLNTVWRVFARERTAAGSPICTSAARFRLPLNPDLTARVGLAVIPIELECK